MAGERVNAHIICSGYFGVKTSLEEIILSHRTVIWCMINMENIQYAHILLCWRVCKHKLAGIMTHTDRPFISKHTCERLSNVKALAECKLVGRGGRM